MDLFLPTKAEKIRMKKIVENIGDDLKLFKRAYKSAMRTDVFLINRITGYMAGRFGKLLRPKLVILSARLFGNTNQNSIASAVLIELLHTATLMHDDVVDRAEERRGIPSIRSLWKNKTAVLMGDFLFSRALINLIDLKDFDALSVLSKTAERMSKGELLQMEKNRSTGMDEATYFKMISDKTASLFSAACEMGALTTTDSAEHRKSLADYGENLGIAFQLKDDLFDFTGKKKHTGKPVGRDVKENLMTLPVIHSLSNGRLRESRKFVVALRKRNGARNFEEVVDFVREKGGLEYTKERLLFHNQKALDAIEGIKESIYKEALVNFVQFNIDRSN